MSYLGHIENGKVVFDGPAPLPEGVEVRVIEVNGRPIDDSFWHPKSLEQLIREQGVKPLKRVEEMTGGWPVEFLNDGFEDPIHGWRGGRSGDVP